MTENSDAIEIEGVLVQHWELYRFVVAGPPRWWGLLRTVENWYPRLPDAAPVPPLVDRETCRYFRMRLQGRLGPRGFFGHRGICSREFFVARVLSCEETFEPGITW